VPREAVGWSSDPTLRALFVDESARRIEALGVGAARLSVDHPDPPLVETLWREAHTLKGGASVVGVTEIVDLAAEVEAILGALRDGRLVVSAVLLDDLRDAVAELRETRERVVASVSASTSSDERARRGLNPPSR
jgi:two-component system, chemotaxis family, sensor kinase CheA